MANMASVDLARTGAKEAARRAGQAAAHVNTAPAVYSRPALPHRAISIADVTSQNLSDELEVLLPVKLIRVLANELKEARAAAKAAEQQAAAALRKASQRKANLREQSSLFKQRKSLWLRSHADLLRRHVGLCNIINSQLEEKQRHVSNDVSASGIRARSYAARCAESTAVSNAESLEYQIELPAEASHPHNKLTHDIPTGSKSKSSRRHLEFSANDTRSPAHQVPCCPEPEKKQHGATKKASMTTSTTRSDDFQHARPPVMICHEVVRGRRRRYLPAFSCKTCDSFYRAAGVTNPNANHREACRHRAHNPPEQTPEGYWNLKGDLDGGF